ncbi:MAG TPA: hypothetical protein VFE13_01750 [Caulobacteraceae bacterium]|nr:hypothetical protein [Caulobacteraceae bacterium]
MTAAISSALLGLFPTYASGTGSSTSDASGGAQSTTSITDSILAVQYAPTAPWNRAQPSQSQLVQKAMSGGSLFNPAAAQLDMRGASADYKNLFALYSGLNSLYAIATEAGAKNTSSLQLTQLSSAFDRGMTQLGKYLGQTDFNKLKISAGVDQQSQTSKSATPAQATSYTTPPLNTTGDSNAEVAAFQGHVSFDIGVKIGGTSFTVPINLDDMGATPRSMGNVVNFMNAQIKVAGAHGVSFAAVMTPATPDTIQVGDKTVTIDKGQQSWALKLNTSPAVNVTLTAPTTGPAIYIGQSVGNATSSKNSSGQTVAADAQNQLLKFDASGASVVSPAKPPNAAPDQISTATLGDSVNSIQATATAPDGSVYVLANVNAAPDGTAAAGGQDVALQKYDSAGRLMFSSVVGSAANASGMSLALSADGSQVAIAGQVTGSLTDNDKVNNPDGANSFVAVYDSQGDQTWISQTDGVTPNQAGGVAFGADGSVYVTGQAQTTTATQGAQGPTNSYLQVYSTKGVRVSNTQVATGGPNTGAGIAVDGINAYVLGVQNGHAVVNEYDMTNAKSPALVATRDLGNLNGGTLAGISVQNHTVYVAGSTHNTSLNAGAVTSAAAGSGLTGFAATLSTSLAPGSIAYYGGSTGDTRVTGMTVSGGDVYLTGSVTGDLPGEAAIGKKDGFVAGLNVSTGAVDYAQRFTGLDGQVAPTSIAVAATGASILDQLGLPQGVVDGKVSNLITSSTGVHAGDSFKIGVNGMTPATITIRADDTMASLATRIAKATGFMVKASASPIIGGGTGLRIEPASGAAVITLADGPADSDALAGLGLKPGMIAETQTKNGVTSLKAGGGVPIYGLGLPASLDLSSPDDIKTAQVQLAGALSVVEHAYQNLKNAATPANVLALQKARASGSTPKYISNEIANYQAALTRLQAANAGSSSSGLAALL